MNFIYDRLYGRIPINEYDLRLFQTKEMARLRQVSLSAIPPWTMPAGICASKFEHSVGVAHLARIVGQKPEFQQIVRDLYFAALAHDMATPPFSHASEYFLVKLFGKDHEMFIDDVFEDSEFSKEVARQGGDIGRVAALIKGDYKPWSDLINGSIDLDNLDNSPRYGLSMGLIQKIPYSPEELAKAYSVKNNQLVLLANQINGLESWEQTRKTIYEFIYSDANLSPGMMLSRALEFAYREGELTRGYFFMTDAEAFDYLLTKGNKRTKTLIERVDRWDFYLKVFEFKSAEVSPEAAAYFSDSGNRDGLADEISEELGIPSEDVCVYLGKDKGFKKIHLPIAGDDGDKEHESKNVLTYMAQAYLYPRWADKAEAVERIIRGKLVVFFESLKA